VENGQILGFLDIPIIANYNICMMRKNYPVYIGISVIIAMFIMAIYFYPIVPERIAIHFNAHGIADSFLGKFWGLFLLPLFSVLLFAIFTVIPIIDPLGKNIKEFRFYYNMFVALFMLFMFYIELVIILWNIGIRLNIVRFISAPIGLIYIYLGVLLLKTKRNWFIGVRTHWTISNEDVWNRTNGLAGRFFIVDGVLVMLSFIYGKFIMFFMVWIVLGGMLFVVIYSYVLWTKMNKEGEL